MSASDFDLPAGLEAILARVCAAEGAGARRQDEVRALLASPPEHWPPCCGAACRPCVEDQKSLAREILARWESQSG